MKILHAYCLNYNIGDYYLGMGVKNLLRRYLGADLIAETNLQGTVFNRYFIENVVNKQYDLLVIGGGGIIHGPHWPNGWFWLIDQELISEIGIPFIVYGAGYNYFRSEGSIPEIGKRHLLETIRRAAHFSVRQDGSLGRLQEEIGVGVTEVPDPGFHINLGRDFSSVKREPFVMVQVANDKPGQRFAGSFGMDAFINCMRNVVRVLSYRYNVILSPHVYDDVELSRRIAIGLPGVRVWEFSRYAFDRAAESVGYYKNAEFVLAMRGHGQIVPMAFGTPVISIENHPKHVGLMKVLGVEDYNVSLSESRFCERLIDRIATLEEKMGEYRTHLKKVNAQMGRESRKAFMAIRDSLNR